MAIKKTHMMHRRCFNGATVCQPDAEGTAAIRLCGKDNAHVTTDWDQTTCRVCLRYRNRNE